MVEKKKKIKPYLTAFTSLNVSKFFRDYIKAYLYQLMSEKKKKKKKALLRQSEIQLFLFSSSSHVCAQYC